MNLIVDKFLNRFLEIDMSKTNASILTGLIEMSHLKIKKEIFGNLNLPYLELVHGYIGTLRLELKMPFFYDNPIIVYIDKVFFHAKQKSINKLKKEEEIKYLQKSKNDKLMYYELLGNERIEVKLQEKAKQKIGEKKDEPRIMQKIINNLKIVIKHIVLRYEDGISNPNVPYCCGIILKDVKIVSGGSEEINNKNKKYKNLLFHDMFFKIIKVDNLSVYLDCFDNKEDLNFQRLISNNINVEKYLIQFLKDNLEFYTYCLSEINIHSKNSFIHQYLLFRCSLSVDILINTKNKINKLPSTSISVEVPQILSMITLTQLESILKLLAYFNLNTLYREGIAKEYYNLKLSDNQKRSYIEAYIKYFFNKYIEKKNNTKFPEELTQMEERLSYDQIYELREYALKISTCRYKINEIDKAVSEYTNNIFNKSYLEQLNKYKEKLNDELQNALAFKPLDDINIFDDLPDFNDDYLNIYIIVEIYIISFHLFKKSIKIKQQNNNNIQWKLYKMILSLDVHHFTHECKIQKVGLILSFSLENIILSQGKLKNPNYTKIIFGDLTSKGKLISIIFEKNPKLPKSDMRLKMSSERKLIVILSLYIMEYVVYRILKIVSTTINIQEVSNYAKKAVSKYIQEAYEDSLLTGNYSHVNIDLDISLNSALILVPINIFDFKNNQCFLLKPGEIVIKTILPPRQNKNIDYSKIKDKFLMYDIYGIDIIGCRISTVENCTEYNNYTGIEKFLLKEFNFHMEYMMSIEAKNPFCDNVVLNIVIPKFDFQINEFQILLIIDYLGNLYLELDKVSKILEGKEIDEEEEINDNINNNKQTLLKPEDIGLEIKNEEEQYIKKKKLIKYKNFIKKWSPKPRKTVSEEILEVEKSKKALKIEVIFKHVKFVIQKNYIDMTAKDYLIFEMKLFTVECSIIENGNTLVKVIAYNTSLYDNEVDENGSFLIPEFFRCLIEKNKTKDNENDDTFIEYKYLYFQNLDEAEMTIKLNDLSVVASFDSLLRLYQFSMYYTYKYLNKVNDIWTDNKPKKLNSKKKSERKTFIPHVNEELNFQNIPEGYINRLKYFLSDNKPRNYKEIFKQKKENSKEYWENKINKAKLEDNKEVNLAKFKVIILIEMNNTKARVPLNPKSVDTPIFDMSFNFSYIQEMYSYYQSILKLPSRKVIATYYFSNNMKIDISFSKVHIDIVYYICKGKFTSSTPEERILCNSRLFMKLNSYIIPNKEDSIMEIEVVIEPLFFSFGMIQFRQTLVFYEKLMDTIYKMFEEYIPYIKPEYVEDPDIILKWRKKTFKRGVVLVIIRNKLKKLERKRRTVKKTEVSENEINITKYNYYLFCDAKAHKISMTFFDNITDTRQLLIDITLKKLYTQFISNTKKVDKNNMSLGIIDTLTNDTVPNEKYDPKKLTSYLYVFCTVYSNYYNLKINHYEPLIEPFDLETKMIQVCSFMKYKYYITIKDIINFNVTDDSIKIINLFLLRYYQDNSKWRKPVMIEPSLYFRRISSTVTYSSKLMHLRNDRKDEIALEFFNRTGLDLEFYFESNSSNKFILKSDELIKFSHQELYQARGIIKYNIFSKPTFSLIIENSEPIENLNYQRNSEKQYSLDILGKNGKYYKIYISIKVEDSGLIKTITFCPSLSFYNDTSFDISININSKNIIQKFIHIRSHKDNFIPINWLLCDQPESNVYINLPHYNLKEKICDHISELFFKPCTEEELEEIENKKEDIENNFIESKHPNNKKILDICQKECENKNESKIINFDIDDKKYYFCFDYFLFESSEFKTIKNENNTDEEDLLNNSGINIHETKDSKEACLDNNNEKHKPKTSYGYMIFFRPLITIINQIPYPLNFSINNEVLEIPVLENYSIYNTLANENDNFNISIKIKDVIYSSNKFNLLENNKYIELKSNNNNKNSLRCHLLKKSFQIKNDNIYINIKNFSSKSYEYIFFFDYLINNRLTENLWCFPCKNGKSYENRVDEIEGQIELPPLNISLLSTKESENDCVIRKNNSIWGKPFDLNTIGLEGSILLYIKEENSKITSYKQLKKINEVACIISSSSYYIYSVIIIFEPRYIIINNLGFDIFYKQKIDKNKPLDNQIYEVKNNSYRELVYQKGDKKIQIGIKSGLSYIQNYSGIIDIEKVKSYDTKIPINLNSIKLGPHSKIFTYDGIVYYILIRVINHTYDNGLVYILFTNTLIPYLEVENKTKASLVIYEKSNEKNKIIVMNPNNVQRFPFTFEDITYDDKEIFFEIYGIKRKFHFADFTANEIALDESINSNNNIGGILKYKIKSENNNLTRRFTIRAKKKKTRKFNKTVLELKMFSKSSLFILFIEGFGISLIDKTFKELFYISFYGIGARYSYNELISHNINKSEITTNIELCFNNFQVDYCLNDSIKQIIYPKNQIIPSNIKSGKKIKNNTPFCQLLFTMSTNKNYKKNEQSSKYDQIDFILQEFNCKFEQHALTNLLNLTTEYTSLLNYTTQLEDKKYKKESLIDIEYPIPIKKLIKENQNASMILIDYLLLSSLKFNLTLRLDLRNLPINLPNEILIIFGSIGNILSRITDSPLKFNERIFKKIYTNLNNIMWKIIYSYTTEGIIQIYKILGSTDLIGNPIKLAENIGEGFNFLLNEPRKAFLLGPMNFGLGVAKGVGGLISGVVGGAFDVVGSITSSLYETTQNMMYSKKIIENYDDEEPNNIFEGIFYGFIGAGKEIAKIFVTFCTIPCEKFKKKGIKGFFYGVNMGLRGIILFPCAAALKFVNSVTVGMKNSLYFLTGRQKLKTTRFRYPRVIIENESPINVYEENKAEAKEIIWKLNRIVINNIIFAEDFICLDKSFYDKFSICIVTDEELFIVYDMRKIIFHEFNKNIVNCTVHFLYDRFIVALHLYNNLIKGFSILKLYSKVTCFLYDFYCKKKILKSFFVLNQDNQDNNSSKNGLFPENKNNNLDTDIDTSNYDKTIVNDSYSHLSSIKSKI